jgi:hypothetical protein
MTIITKKVLKMKISYVNQILIIYGTEERNTKQYLQ